MSNYEDKAETTRNFYRKQGAEAERERIIKLLENTNAKTDYRGNGATFSMREIIALIKGEQK